MRMGIPAVLVLLFLLSLTGVACAGQGPSGREEEAPVYEIMKVASDFDWADIPALPIDRVLWTEDCGIRAQGQLCYDDENLHVHLSAAEKDIRAENTEPLSPVWEDSCLEFFFMLEGADNYFNFEINPNGCLCLQFGPEKTNRINIVRSDSSDYFDIHADRTADGWEVFYRIPLEFLRLFYPEYRFEGDLRANMYKCGDKTVHKHYLSWAPIDLETPNFHCTEFFGRMRFEQP